MKKIIVTGNVGRDPEMRADQNGNQFATFSIGISVGTKQNPKTDWVDVSCNGRLADVAKNYVKKGSKILVEGFPSVNAYINRENKAVGVLRISASNFEFIGGNRESSESDTHEPSSNDNSNVYTLPEANESNNDVTLKSDDIPF